MFHRLSACVNSQMHLFRLITALVLATALSAATYEEMVEKTDMSDADAVYRLGAWCGENNMPSKARQLYSQAIKIDRDHEGARTAMGMVRVGDRWVNKGDERPTARPAGGGGAADGSTPAPKTPSGPGPAAKDVAWDLTIPGEPADGDNAFIEGYLARMPKAGNDSDDMGRCVATLLMTEHWPLAKPRLCKALLSPGFNDIYGAVEIAMELRKRDRSREADQLLPFVAKASERVTDPEDLTHFTLLAAAVRDRRSVPRLVELLAHSDSGVSEAAAEALSIIIHLPAKGMRPEQAKAWWDANWGKSEERILAEQLRSSDAMTQVCAAAALCERRDVSIFPVLFKLLRHEDPVINRKAIQVVVRATGLEFGYVFELPPVERYKKVAGIEKYWKEEKANFKWPGLPREEVAAPVGGKPAAVADPDQPLVKQLGSTAGTEAQAAELQLRGRGTKAVPALIDGLGDPSSLVRLRAAGILREVTRQNLPFDPNGDEQARAKAIDAWREWAVKQGLLVIKPKDDTEP